MQEAAARNDPEAWHQGNAEFHRVVIHRSGNRLLMRMTEGLWDRSIRHFSARVLSQAHFRRLRHKEHQRIVQAIVSATRTRWRQLWRDHVYQSGLETVEYLRSLAVGATPFAPRRGAAADVPAPGRPGRPALRGRGSRPAAVTALRPPR